MDEQRLGDLFREAADDAGRSAPPAAFDHGDVLSGSQALARRQRRRAGAAAGAAAVLIAGTGVLAGQLNPDEPLTSLAQPQPTYSAPYAGDPAGQRAADSAAGPQAAAPGAASGAAPEAAAPAPDARQKSAAPPGPAGCAEPDVRVFAHLATALPGARSTRPYPVPGGCVPGGVGVALDVVDTSAVGGARGTLIVVLVPPGADPGTPPDDGATASAVAGARSGGQVRVTATSAGGQVPYRQKLGQLATQLGGRL